MTNKEEWEIKTKTRFYKILHNIKPAFLRIAVTDVEAYIVTCDKRKEPTNSVVTFYALDGDKIDVIASIFKKHTKQKRLAYRWMKLIPTNKDQTKQYTARITNHTIDPTFVSIFERFKTDILE